MSGKSHFALLDDGGAPHCTYTRIVSTLRAPGLAASEREPLFHAGSKAHTHVQWLSRRTFACGILVFWKYWFLVEQSAKYGGVAKVSIRLHLLCRLFPAATVCVYVRRRIQSLRCIIVSLQTLIYHGSMTICQYCKTSRLAGSLPRRPDAAALSAGSMINLPPSPQTLNPKLNMGSITADRQTVKSANRITM